MRVLLVNKFFHDGARAGGVGRHVLQLQELLEERGHEVIPFGMKDPDTPTDLPTYEFFVSQKEFDGSGTFVQKLGAIGRMFWSQEAAHELHALLDVFRPDVAHVHNEYHHLSPSILAALQKRGIPVVQTAHDYKRIVPGYAFYPQQIRGARAKPGVAYEPVPRPWMHRAALWSAFAFHKLIGAYERNVNETLVPSRFMYDQFVEYGQEASSLRVLPLPRPMDVVADAPGFESRSGLLYVGRLSEEKGLHVFLKALATIPVAERPALRILGDGPQRAELEKLVVELGLVEWVTFAGHVSKEEVGNAMRAARLLVLPTLSCESYGLVVLEAAANGLPAVVSDRGPLPELVEQGRGWTMVMEDATSIAKALQNEGYKRAWEGAQQQSLKWISQESLSPASYMNQLEQIYSEVQKLRG